ncbi:TPR_REGION domain-containing protein [Tenacibaculum sp. 190524A02b]|uniref:TPR_REGION domain-containing protein n=1 Tax=Tenacibaculum vairaonense TaxID=3137860 RepID=A0ABP1FIE6_9FLAO
MKNLILLCFLLVNGVLCAQKDVSLYNYQQHKINSKVLKEQVLVNISLPKDYKLYSKEKVYPVIVVLEPEFFSQIVSTTSHLSTLSGIPECIVISFPNRFSKSYGPQLYTNGSKFWPIEWKQMPFDGDPNEFNTFFKNELFPYLASNLRVAPYNIILGTSSTTPQVFHTFLNEPKLFQGYITIAAGDFLSMGYSSNSNLISAIENSIKKNPRTLNLYVASADSDIQNTPQIGMNLNQLQNKVTPYLSNSIKVSSEIISNETHYGIVLPAYINAMKMIFPLKKWDVDYRVFSIPNENTLMNINQYYEELSKEYGYKILPTISRWNSGNSLERVGEKLIRKKQYNQAIEIFKHIIQYQPKSHKAFFNLAKTHKSFSDHNKAELAIEQAIMLLDEGNMMYLKKYQNILKELQKN